MTAQSERWVLADQETTRDLQSYLTRAQRLDPGGAARVQAVGSVAAVYVCGLHGSGAPTVLGLRTMALAEPSSVDAVVPVAALLDRLARADNGTTLQVPPQEVTAAWAGVLPPRSGWVPSGAVEAEVLAETARRGIDEIATGTPGGAGSAAVAALQTRVWSRPLPRSPLDLAVTGSRALVAGAAFTAHALGFLGQGAHVQVHVAGPWVRLSAPGGYVLTRQPLI